MCVYICIYVHAEKWTSKYTWMYKPIVLEMLRVSAYVCIHIYICIYVYVYFYIYICICTYIYIYVYMSTHVSVRLSV